jgi:hypothetical protein
MLNIVPRVFSSRSVTTIEIGVDDALKLHYFSEHIKLYKALAAEFTSFSIPFDEDYFAPFIYDLVVRPSDLHLMLCTNQSNVLIPATCEQPSMIEEDEEESEEAEVRPVPSEVSHAPEDLNESRATELDQQEMIESNPTNSYLDFNAKQVEIRVSFNFPEYEPAAQHLDVFIDSSRLDITVLFSKYHSLAKLSEELRSQQCASFLHPSFHIASIIHSDRANIDLTDW